MKVNACKHGILALATILLATAIGIVAGLATITADITPAFAAHNCTRYSPNYAVNPPNCTQKYTMTQNIYTTNGYAQRDGNTISMSGQRSWSLWLETLYNTFPQNDSGYGYGTGQGGWPEQTNAGCTRSSSVEGQCYTIWD